MVAAAAMVPSPDQEPEGDSQESFVDSASVLDEVAPPLCVSPLHPTIPCALAR